MRLHLVTTCLAAVPLAGCGVSGNFRHDPGYAEFDASGPLAANREIGLSFGPLPLALAGLVLHDEPEIKSALRELRGVRVEVYDAIRDGERVDRQLKTIQAELIDDGWVALANIRDDDSHVTVMVRPDSDGKGNRGLAVMVQEPNELVLVNLIGNVRLDQLADYMTELDVNVPGIDLDPRQLGAGKF
jgi:hypothetical protein